MKLKTLDSINLKNKTILYRAPYDIELRPARPDDSGRSGGETAGILEVSDDMRIRATLSTLQYLLKENCKIVVLTYVGRPNGVVVDSLRTTPHAHRLSELLNHPVLKLDDCIGPEIEEKIKNMQFGDILMLENVRFYNEEMVDDDEFAKKLCAGKDLIVFDGFPQAHRMHASTTGILRHLPSVAGLYLEREVGMLSRLLQNPSHPFTIIIGGAKISDKVDAIRNLLPIADTFLIGGAVANVFLRAQGKVLGDSFVEDVFVDNMKREKKNWVEEARDILNQVEISGKKIVIPEDLIISDGALIKTIDINTEKIPSGWKAFDIGPKTVKDFTEIILQSRIVFMNGPMGKFEDEKFVSGSEAILCAMKDAKKNNDLETIIAGGDTIDVARRCGTLEDYSLVSLAGGATLEFLAGKTLPALVPLIKID